MNTDATTSPPPDAPEQRPPKQEQEPASSEVTEVAPGVLRTQLPIEMPGLGHVNCYVLEDERGIAVVDPGLPGDESWNHLVDRLGRAEYAVTDVHTVVVTHSHPDHYGGATRLRHESGAEIVTHESFRTLVDEVMSVESEDSGDLDVNSFDEQLDAIERFLSRPSPWGGRRTGPTREFLERLHAAGTSDRALERLRPTRALVDGETIRLARREWVALHTPGHTYDHLCLYDPEHGVVFTGDHVLPTITPHISGMSPTTTDPLAMYFDSLTRVSGMVGVSVALPAHGHPFTDLPGRSRDIIEHHEERLDIIRKATEQIPDGTVNEFMRVLFRERSWGDMAESETYAHLEHLRELGELDRSSADGVARYQPIGG